MSRPAISIIIIAALCFPFLLSAQEEQGGWDDWEIEMEGEGLTVTGSPETTQQMKTVTREQIEKTRANDTASLLQETLGLNLTRRGPYGNQASVNLRGFDAQRIAVLVNGVPVNSAMSGSFDINSIDPASIDHIEVIYGGSDTKYNISGSLGGVINIVTIKSGDPGLSFGLDLANTGYLPGRYINRDYTESTPEWRDMADGQKTAVTMDLARENSRLGLSLFGTRAANHYLFPEPVLKTTVRQDNNEMWDGGASAHYTRRFHDLSRLILSGDFYYGDKNIPSSGYSRFFGTQTDTSVRTTTLYEMPRAFHDDLAMEASLAYHWNRMGFSPYTGASSLHDQHTVSVINRWSWYAGNRFVLRFGGDYRYAWIDSSDLGINDRSDGGLYATSEWQISESFLFIASLKGVAAPQIFTPIPKIGFLWQPLESLSIKNNWFRSFKLPDFEDLYWKQSTQMNGNPRLKPEDGWGVDAGASYDFGRMAHIEGTLFSEVTTGSIHWAADRYGNWKPENVGKAVFFGADTKVNFDLSVFDISLSYQFLRSYLLSYGYDWKDNKRIPYMPAHTINMTASFPWASGSLAVTAHWESGRFADTANITKLNSPLLLNMTLNQNIGNYFTGYIALRNIFNKTYESFDDYYMPGFNFTLGLKFKIEGIKNEK
jgi:vitamin B12 transporter